MFFKNSNSKKETEIKKKAEGEEGEGTDETKREPCEQCGSLEHVACIRPF